MKYDKWDRSRGEARRPFRLWDAQAKCNVPRRYYSEAKRAHLAALCQCRWLDPGASLEVYDCRTARLLGQYTRKVNTIKFTEA